MPTQLKRTFAIVGSRTYPADKEYYDSLDDSYRADLDIKGFQYVKQFMDNLSGAITIVSGGAKGVDTWAVDIANRRGFNVVEIRPNWTKFGAGAALYRNTEIVQAADDVVAFWDQVSRGTYDSIKKAVELRKDLMVFGNDGNLLMAFTQDDYNREDVKPKMVIPRTSKTSHGRTK